MQNLDWDKILNEMHFGVAEVTFKKADGTMRVMQCTLANYLLPETKGGKSTTSGNPDIVVVFDLEKEAWRSFKKSTVTEVVLHGKNESD